MLNFEFCSPTQLVFGKDTHKDIGSLVAPHAKKVLLHYGGGSIKRSGLYDDVLASLKKAGVDCVELGGVQANPRLELAREGVALCKREGVELVLAVGGGSVIDSGKCIALGSCYDGDVWDFYMGAAEPKAALPVATVLTIPAAGSELSSDSVVSFQGRKIGFGHQLIRPVVSVINPELFYTLPKNQMANGVCDMMSHVMERYFTNTLETGFIDGLCESTLRTMMRYGLVLVDDIKNYDAWSQIGFAGAFCHNGFLGLGRDQDWACHMMEHELSAEDEGVAHGAGLAVLTPAWMRYVYKDNMDMFGRFAYNVMCVENTGNLEADILKAIDAMAEFFAKMGQPSTLTQLGLGGADLTAMAQKCTGYIRGSEQPKGGLKKLYWQDVLAIYQAVL